MIDRLELARLEQLRLSNPKKANRLLEKAVDAAPPELVGKVLSAFGASFRQLDRLADSRWAYFAAQKWAESMGDPLTLGEIQQRRSWVEFTDGDFHAAMAFLRTALGIFSEIGDRNRAGKVFVDLAIQYHDRGSFSQALPCTRKALCRLDESEFENRASAHQMAASSSTNLGDPSAAFKHLEKGRRAVAQCAKPIKVRFLWMEARLSKEISLVTAASVFLDAVEILLDIGEVLDAALAALEYVSCRVELNQFDPVETTELLRRISFNIEGKLATGVLLNVYREGLKGQISQALLHDAMLELKQLTHLG
jgi:tetratricopeptide (TPR) repeat protein